QLECKNGIFKTNIIRILLKKICSYHLFLYQDLHRTEFVNRIHFSQWNLQQYESDQSFFRRKT
ncbi:hypothetical protein WN51_09010, partial [Melipona quadrifasciata]